VFVNRQRVPLTERVRDWDDSRIAALAACLAAVPPALQTLGGEGGFRQYVPILAMIGIVMFAVFAWGVPSALTLAEPGPSTAAVALSGLSVLTLLLFWTGIPVVFAAGGIVVGRTQLDVPGDRRLALAAIRISGVAIVLYLLLFLADVL
jgi:hypothetical protein